MIHAKDGTVVARKKTGYLTDAAPGHEHQRVDDWLRVGNAVPEFTSEFVIPDAPGLDRELRDLGRDARMMGEAEHVAHENVTVGDPPLERLDDASVVAYLDDVLKETNNSGPEATCSNDNYAGIDRSSATNSSASSGDITEEACDALYRRTTNG